MCKLPLTLLRQVEVKKVGIRNDRVQKVLVTLSPPGDFAAGSMITVGVKWGS